MSLLPQRKKSPEEIAKLRESLGIAAPPPGAPEEMPLQTEPTTAAPKSVHSLKKSERIPALPLDGPGPASPVASKPPITAPLPRPVRSLRKSEQTPVIPVLIPEPSLDSKIPVHRHSDRELNELRRREALAMMTPAANPRLSIAHPALLAPGYLFALAGAVCFYFYQLPLATTAACVAAAMIFAVFIFLRRPISRHHAAFIAVLTLFVAIFAALHYFPQLRHAT
jgi:hypothetical protein